MKTIQSIATIKNPNPTPIKKRKHKIPFIGKVIRFSFKNISHLAPKTFGKLAWTLFQRPVSRAEHRKSDALLESVKRFDFPHKNLNIKGYSWGEGEKTALLVHGWGSRGTAMRNFAPTLVSNGYRVVTLDAPAHGDSSGKKVNPFLYAQVIAALIEHLGGVEMIIGHSFGGFSSAIMLSKVAPHIQVDQFICVASFTSSSIPFGEFKKVMRLPDKVLHQMEMASFKQIGTHPKEGNLLEIPRPQNIKQLILVHDKDDNVCDFQHSQDIYHHWKADFFIQTKDFGHFKILHSEAIIQKIIGFIRY